MSKETILVTGGTGFIGSHTTVELQEAGYEVVIVDNLSNSDESVLDGIERITGLRPKFYKSDCNDLEAMRRVYEENPTIVGVIHFAASKAVGESVEKPLLYYHNNIVSLINQLTLMTEYRTKGIVFSSSCTVYGQPEKLPVDETAPFMPATSPYGNTKQINEEILRDTIHSGVPFKAISLRYFNPIGAHPSAHIGEEPRGVPANLIPYITQAAAGIRTGKGESVLELITAFERATGVKVPYKIGPRREGDIVAVWADPKKANDYLDWQAQSTIEDSLRSAWKWQEQVLKRNQK